ARTGPGASRTGAGLAVRALHPELVRSGAADHVGVGAGIGPAVLEPVEQRLSHPRVRVAEELDARGGGRPGGPDDDAVGVRPDRELPGHRDGPVDLDAEVPAEIGSRCLDVVEEASPADDPQPGVVQSDVPLGRRFSTRRTAPGGRSSGRPGRSPVSITALATVQALTTPACPNGGPSAALPWSVRPGSTDGWVVSWRRVPLA